MNNAYENWVKSPHQNSSVDLVNALYIEFTGKFLDMEKLYSQGEEIPYNEIVAGDILYFHNDHIKPCVGTYQSHGNLLIDYGHGIKVESLFEAHWS